MTVLASVLLTACAAEPPRNGPDGDASSRLNALFNALHSLPEPLDRWHRIQAALADSDAAQAQRLLQTRAAIEAELGLYREARDSFPLPGTQRPPATQPTPQSHVPTDAVELIAARARNHRIVLVNEAHHIAQTRALSLALLPQLRALGYTHFAAETLDDADTGMAVRGYPLYSSGGYSKEPVYGELIRTALRLGYVVVPYEHTGSNNSQQARETGQAAHLMQRVFTQHSNARLFVHAGYAHIDLRIGRLWQARPMAMELQQLTGYTPLSIEQTLLLSAGRERDADWLSELLDAFPVMQATVLLDREHRQPWSYDPSLHTFSVLLPHQDGFQPRPAWLDLGGERLAWPISPSLCANTFPCAIQAQYADEGEHAVAADRYTWLSPQAQDAALYLYPGRYHLTARTRSGVVAGSTRLIEVSVPPNH